MKVVKCNLKYLNRQLWWDFWLLYLVLMAVAFYSNDNASVTMIVMMVIIVNAY